MRRTICAAGLIAALLVPFGATASADGERYLDEVFTDVAVTHDIVYGGATNDQGAFEELTLDLYEPVGDDATEERPVFVWAHGGSLVFGDKGRGLEQQVGHAFARRGWVVASINYRLMSQFIPDCPNDILCALSPSLPFALRDAMHDMQAAVRWFRANAEDRRIDPDEITVGGHSAGAGVALYTNFSSDDPGNSGNPGHSSRVAAAMTNSGSMLDPLPVGLDEPPIAMFNAIDDVDLTAPLGYASACLTTTLFLNDCEMHMYPDGGHSLSIHRAEIFQRTAEFFCRRVIDECDVAVPEATTVVGPTGSRWDGDVHCGPEAVGLLELCLQGALGPLQGRGFLDLSDGTIDDLGLDGDADNPLYGGSLNMPGDPATIAQAYLDILTSSLGSLVPL